MKQYNAFFATRLNGFENKFFLFIFFYNACSFIYKQTIH